MERKILVTPRSLTKDGHPALARLSDRGFAIVMSPAGKQPGESELMELLPGCAGYLAGVEPITARALSCADALKVISRNGTGVDNIDMEAARSKNIKICRAEGANARGVAELAFAHILALVRAIPFSDAALKNGGWERRIGSELAGRTLGIIGTGRIGAQVARFGRAFGMLCLGFDPYPNSELEPLDVLKYADLEGVMKNADIISLHCPMPRHGRPLIDAAAIQAMKKGVFLVNTARAGLLDTEAVLAALASGLIAGVAIDVFDQEPPVDRRLLSNDRVIASPHIGGFTAESVNRAVEAAVDNLLDALKETVAS